MANAKKVMIGFKTDSEVKAKLEAIAYAEDRSVSYIVNRIISKELEEVQKPERVLEYIDSLSFNTYSEFLQIVIKDGKLAWIIRDLGELQAYLIVCDKLGVSANPDKIAEIVSDDTDRSET